jgi:hypothetical protein
MGLSDTVRFFEVSGVSEQFSVSEHRLIFFIQYPENGRDVKVNTIGDITT